MSAVRVASGLMEALGYLPKVIGMQRPDMRHVHMHKPPDHATAGFLSLECAMHSQRAERLTAEVVRISTPPRVGDSMGLYADSVAAERPMLFWDLPDGVVVEVAPEALRAEWQADFQKTIDTYRAASRMLAAIKRDRKERHD